MSNAWLCGEINKHSGGGGGSSKDAQGLEAAFDFLNNYLEFS